MALIIVLFLTLAQQPTTTQPSLKETLTWMHNFAADNASQVIGQSTENNQDCKLGTSNCQQRHDETTFDSQGCDATIKWSITFDYKDHGTYTHKVSLKNLDPNSVKIVKDRPFEIAVLAETINNEKLITQSFAPPKESTLGTSTQTQAFVELVFSSQEYANRFAKALRLAIRLCGGKPSAF